MPRHRTPLERPDREADLIAPVISLRPETADTAGADPSADAPSVDGPSVDSAARDAAVPTPRRPSDVTPRGRHAVRPEPDASDDAGRHRTPQAPASPAGAPSDPAETAAVAPTAGHHRAAPDAPVAGLEKKRRHRRAEQTGGQLAAGTSDGGATTSVLARDDAEITGSRADTAVLTGEATSRHAADASPRRHRRAESRHADTRPAGRRHSALRSGNRRRSALVLVTVAAGLLALPTVSSASADQCRWQRAAHNLLVALGTRSDDRSDALRTALTQAGVGAQLPAECTQRSSEASTATAPSSTTSATTSATRPTSTKPTASSTTSTYSADPTTTSKAAKPTTDATATATADATVAAAAAVASGSGSTAAAAFGWGTPTKSDDFTGGLGGWGLYDGPGHGGNGRRTPSAASVANGMLTITGDSNGNSEGMAWGDGQKYGRWEARVRSTAGDDSYHPVMLLWPDAENWPVGGEVDWMEISDANRQDADTFLHYGSSNNQVSGSIKVDATQWHNWAVEWSPQGITTYLDGKVWWKTTNTSILPPGPMHMTIQLDYFGGGNPKTSQMMVDWVHQYQM